MAGAVQMTVEVRARIHANRMAALERQKKSLWSAAMSVSHTEGIPSVATPPAPSSSHSSLPAENFTALLTTAECVHGGPIVAECPRAAINTTNVIEVRKRKLSEGWDVLPTCRSGPRAFPRGQQDTHVQRDPTSDQTESMAGQAGLHTLQANEGPHDASSDRPGQRIDGPLVTKPPVPASMPSLGSATIVPTSQGREFAVDLRLHDSHSFVLLLTRGQAAQAARENDSLVSDMDEVLCIITARVADWVQPPEPGAWQPAPLYPLTVYDSVYSVLARDPRVHLIAIPTPTLPALRRYQEARGEWTPGSAQPVDLFLPQEAEWERQLRARLPPKLYKALLPFQKEGVRYGVERGGRCLIADEMGVGKSIQAIALAAWFASAGPLLVVCPASMRLPWAEEIEKWLPHLKPQDIRLGQSVPPCHLRAQVADGRGGGEGAVFGRRDDITAGDPLPSVLVVSYHMLGRLTHSIGRQVWGTVIVDECHNVRTSPRQQEQNETRAVMRVAQGAKHAVLLSGTPSITRPFDLFNQVACIRAGVLGGNKHEFGRNYCGVDRNAVRKDYSKGQRLEELNVLLTTVLMIRRLKSEVMGELPPKRRQVIRVTLTSADVEGGRARVRALQGPPVPVPPGESNRGGEGDLTAQELGIAKLAHVKEWLSNHPIIVNADAEVGSMSQSSAPKAPSRKQRGVAETGTTPSSSGKTPKRQNRSPLTQRKPKTPKPQSQGRPRAWVGEGGKMLIFAHHHEVLDRLQEHVQMRGVGWVRVDGGTPPRERRDAVEEFRCKREIQVAIVGVTAGGVGLDFSSAQTVVFAELPTTSADMLQAEDRAHRRGQRNAVNVYIFCAKDSADDSRWQHLSGSAETTSLLLNGPLHRGGGLAIHTIADTASAPCTHLDLSQMTPPRTPPTDQIPDPPCPLSQPHTQHPASQTKAPRRPMELFGRPKEAPPHPIRLGVEAEPGMSPTAEARASCQVAAEELLFQVSAHTGRLHVYAGGERRRHLGVNLRPEELQEAADRLAPPGTCEVQPSGPAATPVSPRQQDEECHLGVEWSGAPPGGSMGAPAGTEWFERAHWAAARRFMREWGELRVVHQRKLQGGAVGLPVAANLVGMGSEQLSSQGVVRGGGSRRRVTPVGEIQGTPGGASSGKVRVRVRRGMWRMEKQSRNEWGAAMCRMCKAPYDHPSCSSVVEYKDLFCTDTCLHQYLLQTSSGYVRQALGELECGVCCNCQLDCRQLVLSLKVVDDVAKRRSLILKAAPAFADHSKLLEHLALRPAEGSAWHADHIVGVHQGGGECGLENLRTLCVICHKGVSAEQRRQAAEKRMAEKEAKKKEEEEEKARVAKEKEAAFIALVGEYAPSPWLEEEAEMKKQTPPKPCMSIRVSPTFLDSFKYKKVESANSEMMTQPNSDSDDELLAICVNG